MEHTCQQCGKTFSARKGAIYCGQHCRNLAYQQNKYRHLVYEHVQYNSLFVEEGIRQDIAYLAERLFTLTYQNTGKEDPVASRYLTPQKREKLKKATPKKDSLKK
jgi:hypothetical protein